MKHPFLKSQLIIFVLFLQSSPSFNSGYASQRMHHNIPHRLQSQMVMRPTNCAVCLDSIHFGRQVSVCQDCGASAHVKCASHLPRTCGLPVGLAEHFGTVIGQETPVAGKRGESTTPSTSQMKGFVKIPRLGKATCWERKYMKVCFSFFFCFKLHNLTCCFYFVRPAVEWH